MHRPATFKTLLLAIACIFLFSAPAAARINEAGTARLKTMFTDLLATLTETAAANGTALVAEGEIMVEPSDFYYAVTLPHLTVRQRDGAYTEIGMLAFNVMPGDSAGLWKMTVAVPTPVVHYDRGGVRTATLNVGSQNFAGIWHEKFRNFTKANARYKDIEMILHQEDVRISVPDTKLKIDLAQDQSGLWSGPTELIVTGLQGKSVKSGATLGIGEIRLDSRVHEYSLEAALAYQEQLSALTESYEAGDRPSASGTHVLGLYNMVFGYIGNGFDGFDLSLALKDLTMTRPPLSVPGAPPGSINIGKAGGGFSMGGLRKGLVTIGLKMNYDSFTLKPENAGSLQDLAPAGVNFDLQVNNLPYKEIVDLGRGSIQTAMQDAPQAAKFAGLQAIMVLPQLLTQAQTNLAVNDTRFGNAHYDVKTSGVVTADLKAVAGATGSMRTEIRGLEKLVGMLGDAAKNEELDDEQAQKIKETLSMLTIMQMVGQMGKNTAGQDIRSYNLELNQQGQMLLNGADIKALMPAKE